MNQKKKKGKMIVPDRKIVTVRLTFAFLGVALIIKTAYSIEIEDIQFLHKGQICVKILKIHHIFSSFTYIVFL